MVGPDRPSGYAWEPRRNHRCKHIVVHGLGEVVVRAKLPTLQLIVVVTKRGEEDERHALEPRLHGREPLEQLKPGHSRHAYVGQHQIRWFLEDGRKTVTPVVGCTNLEPAIDELLTDQCRGVTI